jgi:RNA polymerase sigma-54 factor
VNVVLARQREFFDYGPQFLKPLPMVEVAEQLGIHVGTVSRAVAGKWLQTPRGFAELRKFFSGGLETASGEDRSWDAIKAMLREVVDAEDKSDPLSDQALATKLKERGVSIARRTVVKYREQLGIPPARQRKVHG